MPVLPTKRTSTETLFCKDQICMKSSVESGNLFLSPQNSDSDPLLTTLKDVFGHSAFRHGQREVIEAALRQNDVCVFWATGTGKSLCYQFPAFYLQKPVIVVSPLISLMQDQVHKLNSMFKNPVAQFLGSAQKDAYEEERALRGEYLLIYCSPEKLTSDGFLGRLKTLDEIRGIGLFAIDEAHCISSWGADFRREYAALGKIRHALPLVPIMAATATADARQRADVQRQLGLSPDKTFVASGSIDRPNLYLSVKRKTSLGRTLSDQLSRLVKSLLESPDSTIIYTPTRAAAERVQKELVDQIKAQLNRSSSPLHAAWNNPSSAIQVYHAGMSTDQRHKVHMDFLQDRSPVIVSTIAFGMGIDKPDIRRVVHFGAPKTFEEYYQQIGRAGRDGLPSVCELVYSDGDFAKYLSGFFTDNLDARTKEHYRKSLGAVRMYATDVSQCRRRALLRYFGDEPTFERCENCDWCQDEDLRNPEEADFTEEAHIFLRAVERNNKKGLTAIVKEITAPSSDADFAMLQSLLPKKRTSQFFKEFARTLVQKELISEEELTFRSTVYIAYDLTPKGLEILSSADMKKRLFFPVPPSCAQEIRKAREAEEKISAALQKRKDSKAANDIKLSKQSVDNPERTVKNLEVLQRGNINLSLIPAEELAAGAGPTFDVYLRWCKLITKSQSNAEAANVENDNRWQTFLDNVLEWRRVQAEIAQSAPAAILSDVMARRIVLATPRSLQALEGLGVRSSAIDGLLRVCLQFQKQYRTSQIAEPESDEMVTVFPAFSVPLTSWDHAQISGSWEQSYDDFLQGQHVVSIASKRGVAMKTIENHFITALLNGRPLDIGRWLEESDFPQIGKSEWERTIAGIRAAEGDPIEKSGQKLKDIARCIIGPIVDAELKDPEQREQESRLYFIIRLALCHVRVGFPVEFQHSAKRQKAETADGNDEYI